MALSDAMQLLLLKKGTSGNILPNNLMGTALSYTQG